VKPQSFDWGQAAQSAREGMQGQTFMTVLSSQNAPGTPACKVIIQMDPGKVSNVHIHEHVDVYVDVLEADGGVLTLAGERLEHEVWTHRSQSLWIPAGIPHVAVYPRRPAPQGRVFAMETRLTSSATADVIPLDDMAGLLATRLEALGLSGRVIPSAQMVGYRRDDASCFPSRP
jgi:uncharacterized RmlC-like cupin family protein